MTGSKWIDMERNVEVEVVRVERLFITIKNPDGYESMVTKATFAENFEPAE